MRGRHFRFVVTLKLFPIALSLLDSYRDENLNPGKLFILGQCAKRNQRCLCPLRKTSRRSLFCWINLKKFSTKLVLESVFPYSVRVNYF